MATGTGLAYRCCPAGQLKETENEMPNDNVERRFLRAVDSYTRTLPDYDRGVATVLALAAFKTGYRCAEDAASEVAPRATAEAYR